MWKKYKVVMLATNKAVWPNCIWLGRISSQLRLDQSYDSSHISDPIDNSMLPQHLYILSDDEIKEGDWFIAENRPQQCIDILDKMIHFRDKRGFRIVPYKGSRKIIATTDSSIRSLISYDSSVEDSEQYKYLPSIPQSFIDKYVSEYNKGNTIEEVRVEYEDELTPNRQLSSKNRIPKINPDNTINIKSIKDSWTRDEVKHILFLYYDYCMDEYNGSVSEEAMDIIIEENL